MEGGGDLNAAESTITSQRSFEETSLVMVDDRRESGGFYRCTGAYDWSSVTRCRLCRLSTRVFNSPLHTLRSPPVRSPFIFYNTRLATDCIFCLSILFLSFALSVQLGNWPGVHLKSKKLTYLGDIGINHCILKYLYKRL